MFFYHGSSDRIVTMTTSIADLDDLLRRAYTEPTVELQEAKWRADPTVPRPVLWQLAEDAR